MHGVIGLKAAMHPQHAKPVLAGCRVCAQPHQSGRDRKTRFGHQRPQSPACFRSCIYHAAARIENRSLGSQHEINGLLNRIRICRESRMIRAMTHTILALIGPFRELHVLRNVDNHRPGTTGRRHIKGFVDYPGQIVHVAHEIVVLGTTAGDTDRVAFLKRIGANEMARHLSGDDHHGNGIHHGVRNWCDGVCRSGPGRHEHDTRLAGGPRIALGGMTGTLLMANQNVANLLLPIKRIIDRQNGPTRITEEHLYALLGQGSYHNLGTAHHVRLELCPCCCIGHDSVLALS